MKYLIVASNNKLPRGSTCVLNVAVAAAVHLAALPALIMYHQINRAPRHHRIGVTVCRADLAL